MARTARAPRLPYMPPQEERHHYVFTEACGCPFGLVEASPTKPGGPPRLADEDAAWSEMYDSVREYRHAVSRGVRVVHVDHATYVRDFYPKMRGGPDGYRCPHGSA